MSTAEQNGVALAVRDATDLAPRFVVSLDEIRRQLRDLEEFKRSIMVEGVDYGTIPGTPKPTLLKPGAEKLSLAFALAPTFEPANRVEDWERGFFHYEERCVLTNKRTGDVVASANGSANSKEPRYRWRKAERVCPACQQPAIIKGKEQYGGGWLCFAKKGGCGAKFGIEDRDITEQVVGNIENPEPYELTNTILKMAQKRALVAAVLIATGGSGIWTQDIEDMPSVSGDGPQIVDVQAAPQPEMVRSADNRVWRRWLEVLAEAQGLGIKVKEVRLPIPLDVLKASGEVVLEAITNRKAELDKEPPRRTYDVADYTRIHGSDEEGTAFADQQPAPAQDAVLVTHRRDARWSAFTAAAAQADAEGFGVPDLHLPIPAAELADATETLIEMVAARRADVAVVP